MNIARLLNDDDSVNDLPMSITNLLNPDDSAKSDHDPDLDAANSQAPSSPTPPPSPQRSLDPAPPPERTVMPHESLVTSAPLSQRVMTLEHSPGGVVTPAFAPDTAMKPGPTNKRAVARARPPRPRKPSIQSLRAQVEAFEFVVKYLPYVLRDLDDASLSTSTIVSADSEDDTIDLDARRMCSFLKRTVLLTKEAQEEIAKRTEYLRLLKRHYEGTANLRKLMRGVELDGWFWMSERWRSLTHDYYEPLSENRCYEIVQETLQAIKTHKLPIGTKETGGFGWSDWVHLDADEHFVRFMTRKTMWNTDMKQLVDQTWSLYWDGDYFKKAHLGHNCEFFLQVLQEISPDVMIVQRVEQHPGIVQPTHSLGIAFRVQTDTGYLIGYRCIESPQLQSLMKAEGLSLCGSFTWDTFDVAHRDEQGECDAFLFTVAGSIGSDDPAYARQARDGILNALVRYEIELMDSAILPIEPSTEEANDTSINSQAAP